MNPNTNSKLPPIPDWMLTAYALKELDASDQTRVASALASNPSLQHELAHIQSTLDAVQSVLGSHDASLRLNSTQSSTIEACISQANPVIAPPIAILPAMSTVPVPPVSALSKLKDRPFYRRKRFAALLATAALVPIGAMAIPRIWQTDLNVADSYLAAPEIASHARPTGDMVTSNPTAQSTSPSKSDSEIADAPQISSEPVSKYNFNPSPSIPDNRTTLDDLFAVEAKDEPRKGVVENFEKAPIEQYSFSGGEADESRLSIPTVALSAAESKPTSTTQRSIQITPLADGRMGRRPVRGVPLGGSGAGMGGEGVMSGYGGDGLGSGGYGIEGVAMGPAGPTKRTIRPVIADDKPSSSGGARGAIQKAPGELPKGKLSEQITMLADGYVDKVTAAGAPLQSLPEELRHNAPDAFRRRQLESKSGDRFEQIVETPFIIAEQSPLSTFSIDVDTASYTKIRQYLMQSNRMPHPNMVRIEEMINYFEYDYAGPKDDTPFAAHLAVDRCPWNTGHRLVRIGLQAKKLDMKQRANANIVFLLDVSGSMDEPNKLPLVKKSLSMLASQLGENDKVAIVVYAGAAGCVLPSTSGANKQVILSALDHLHAGGSTNGGQGIQLAYSIARENFIPGGVNRVILCTDGDFNVGVTGDDALVEMMQSNAKSNVFLTCLGFGIGNYNDSMMEKISNKGNGIYGMIDNEIEARRMMVEQLSGTLVTVAKDVKIQVDFNPAQVASYRLIGYEDRRLANRDFDDDRKDAGEIGAGHRVTALYEIVPVGAPNAGHPVEGESSKYQTVPKKEIINAAVIPRETAAELLTLKVRYKQPEGSESTKQEFVLKANQEPAIADADLQWAQAVAEFGLLLRGSQLAKQADWSSMMERAEQSTRGDAYRLECIEMMRRARQLAGQSTSRSRMP